MTFIKRTLLLHLFLIGGAALSTAWAQGPAGAWQGSIELETPLAIGVTFVDDADGLTGTIDIPAQGIADLPLTDVTLSGNNLSFGMQGVPGAPVFDGTVTGSGEAARIAGDFTQSGQTFPFTLTRGAVAAAARPQEPQPPFPYRSEAVQFQNGAVTLAGTLTLPEGEGPFAAVLFITGSGPQDRDETIAGHKPFLLLADTLTRAGYATLRVDDRGVGGSSGDLGQATYDDLIGDVLAGVAFLKDHAATDRERIGLFGHSEGGYLAPLVAERSDDVAFVIMMAGPAVSGEEVLLLQNRLIYEGSGLPEAQVEAQVAFIRQLSTLLEQKNYEATRVLSRKHIAAQYASLPQSQRPSPAEQEAVTKAQMTNYLTPNFRAFVTYDPRPALEALDVPVLAFYGGKDIQVPPRQSAPVLRELLSDNTDATVRVFPNFNHLMQPATTGGFEEYAQIETTLSPAVLELVTNWLAARF